MNKKHPVQYAHGISTEALHDLWITCFPEDANGFAKKFLDNYFRPEQAVCIVSEDGTTPESALYWLPCTYQVGGCSGTLFYIYAMGTHPDFRRKGNLRAMLEFTEGHCLKHGIGGLVLHAMDTSKSSVEAFGMKPILTLGETTVQCPYVGKEPVWCPGTFEDFSRLRRDYLCTLPGCIYWDERELRFVYEDLQKAGKLRFFRDADEMHYIIMEQTKAGLLVEETDGEAVLLSKLSGRITIRKPGVGVYGSHIKIYTKSLQDKDACKLYFTLMLK